MPDRLIINLETGEQRTVGYYAYWGTGLPDGFKDFDSISKEDLWNAIRKMKGYEITPQKSKKGNFKIVKEL